MAAFSAMAISCSDTNEEEPAHFHLSQSSLNIGGEGGVRIISIDSNTSWFFEASTNYDWATVSPSSGYGPATISIIIAENPTQNSRTAYFNYKYVYDGGNAGNYITITQSGNSNAGGNTGGGNNNNTGGNTGGGSTQQKPSAPTGISVSNEGSAAVPSVVVRWNTVSGATKYYVYRSSSANGSYSKIGEATYNVYADSNAPTNGGSAYYKVKAVNSAGESAFSDYALYTSETNDKAFSPAYTYGSCTVSGTTMTLRWTNSSGYGYGKATSIVLRVWNPYAEEWQDTQLSATATSASFNFSTKIDSYGYVKAGIVVSNDKGSFTAGAKIYDANSKKWLN